MIKLRVTGSRSRKRFNEGGNIAKVKLGKYRHFKGKEYEVIGIAHHSETLEELVIYRALYDSDEFGKNALWARPKELFLGTVDKSGKTVPRFDYIGK